MAGINEVLCDVFERLVDRMTNVEHRQVELAERVDRALAAASLDKRLREQREDEFMVHDALDDDDFNTGFLYHVDAPIVAGHAPSSVSLRMEIGKHLVARRTPTEWCCPLPRAGFARVWLHVAADFDWAAQKEALKTFVKAHPFLHGVRVNVVTEEQQAQYSETLPTRVTFDVSCDYNGPRKHWDELLAAALDTAAAIGCVCVSSKYWMELMGQDDPLWLGDAVLMSW